MSAWELTETTAKPAVASAHKRPQLTSLPGAKATGVHLPFAAAIVAIIVAGMIGLLALNVHIQKQAFALRDAQRRASALGLQVSDLQGQVFAKSAPGALAAAASGLGMVPNPYPNYVDLRTGKVTGNKPVTGSEVPGLLPHAAAPAPAPDAAASAPASAAPASPSAAPSPSASASAAASQSARPSARSSAAPTALASPAAAAKPATSQAPVTKPSAKAITTPKA